MYTLTPAWEIHFHLVYTLNSSLVYCAMPGVNPIMGNGTHEKGLKDEGLGFGFHVSAALPRRRNMNPEP